MITIENLYKSFGGQTVLRNVSMHVEPGEIYGIVGHSGAGKSTLLRCLNGLEPYDSGSVQVMGQEVKALDYTALLRLRSKMGMIFQTFNLMGRKNVYDNVAFPMRVWGLGKKEIRERVQELLALVGLTDKSQVRIQSLSGGQKQRVGIARALALKPPVLLCDEATSALDPQTTASILELIEDINRQLNLTVIMVTHQMEVVKRLCHKMLLLDKGETQAQGVTEDLFLAPGDSLHTLTSNEFTYIPGGTNIRLMFPRDISQHHVITTMARELNLDFSIVGGKLERYLDDVLGFLIINIPDVNVPAVQNYLQSHALRWEVLPLEQAAPPREEHHA